MSVKTFTSFGAFATHLMEATAKQALALNRGLNEVAQRVEDTAKAEIGHYQPGVGPFQAWAQLAESTKADRVAHGFTENDPLLRSGELRDSYEHQVHGYVAIIGSKSKIALWQELGTSRGIPPRAVLGPAVIHNHPVIMKILGGATVAGIMGRTSIPSALSYDHTV
ncbi:MULTISPECIES: hypothetical protein [Burkholderia cepacia complex]|uniref:hypothetical protein n=1 Tax=Burkholderia cepacia complex TaxID=87882 RepID=UPI0020113860|nr:MULTISPECIES: hypothetical protein [Burkholderia cepacia complex]MDR9052058.1 hypothetical protein [Burkholderia multivorans]MDR9060130.1 hypothetical protein [Burkholderia multivorans]MDR9062435.1 hypothetical protein [Burkholderia multivorans]MDR9072217.1 hypothetical protein [Burkholderia multivorans]MDR9076542.1 hypothetical protein [Burkholderia multivorans]